MCRRLARGRSTNFDSFNLNINCTELIWQRIMFTRLLPRCYPAYFNRMYHQFFACLKGLKARVLLIFQ